MSQYFSQLHSKTYLKALSTLALLLFFNSSKAQDKCGTVQYQELLKKQHLTNETDSIFESWLQKEIILKEIERQNAMSTFSSGEVLTIPVVIHIIHNGEPVGVGSNISTDRILSQMEVLNEDFRRLNADSVNTPSIFQGLAADPLIEFVLAKRDPEGLSTNGIVRKKGSFSEYAMLDNWELKSNSYWPSEDYLNIWVAPLKNKLLGFAQFPQSNTEPGLEEASAYQYTDGVVIDFEYFGINNDVSPVSKGRTATHEIGHFLGLRHIWGDGGCDVDDFCDDTPTVGAANFGCPTKTVESCGNQAMYQNFMDYTDDVCMNIFTEDQKTRLHAVLTSSPRRASLLESKGGIEPAIVANDLGIKRIISPLSISCENIVAPEIIIKNYGENDISSFQVLYTLNNDTIDSINQTVSLQPLDSIKLAFPTTILADTSNFSFNFIIQHVNDTTDGNLENNNKIIEINTPNQIALPLVENFENEEILGSIFNPDQQFGWQKINAPGLEGSNNSLRLEFFEYNANLGDKDFYFTPIFALEESKIPVLTFSYAYAEFSGGSNDGLEVRLSTDCGVTYNEDNILFNGFGEDIATAEKIGGSFLPLGRLEWKTVQIDLSDYKGQSNLRVSFAGINDYGNNIYLDNIEIKETTQHSQDLKLLKIAIPPVSCTQTITPEVLVVNTGASTIDNFTVKLSSVWDEDINISYSGLSIVPMDTISVDLPAITSPFGTHSITVDIQNPNGTPDGYPQDNIKSVQFVIDSTRETLPLRQKFDSEDPDKIDWFVFNPDNETTWELINTPGNLQNKAIFINHFDYEAVNEEDWLVSPILDFREKEFINLSFSVSYAYNFNYKERFKLLVSTDCGNNYTSIAYDISGEDISDTYSSKSWNPEDKDKWQKFSVSLNEFIGEENVRIAFVMENGYGNNLYLDDIEFFISEQPDNEIPIDKKYVFPNPSSDFLPITFNLQEKEPVLIALYDLRGKMLFQEEFPNTLNQRYNLNINSLPSAVYILKISGTTFNDNKRILIQK